MSFNNKILLKVACLVLTIYSVNVGAINLQPVLDTIMFVSTPETTSHEPSLIKRLSHIEEGCVVFKSIK